MLTALHRRWYLDKHLVSVRCHADNSCQLTECKFLSFKLISIDLRVLVAQGCYKVHIILLVFLDRVIQKLLRTIRIECSIGISIRCKHNRIQQHVILIINNSISYCCRPRDSNVYRNISRSVTCELKAELLSLRLRVTTCKHNTYHGD